MSIRSAAIGAGVVLVALAAAWAYGRYQYSQGVTDTETAAKLAAAEQYRADVIRINSAIGHLQGVIEDLQNAKPTVITEYRDRVVQNPLPSDCRIDDGRLRVIQDGIAKARSAGESLGAMP